MKLILLLFSVLILAISASKMPECPSAEITAYQGTPYNSEMTTGPTSTPAEQLLGDGSQIVFPGVQVGHVFTVSFWVELPVFIGSSFNNQYEPLVVLGSGDDEIVVYYYEEKFYVEQQNGSMLDSIETEEFYIYNSWAFVVLEFQESEIKFFVNGQQLTSTSGGLRSNPFLSDIDSITVGKDSSAAFSDFKLYLQKLDEQFIRCTYNGNCYQCPNHFMHKTHRIEKNNKNHHNKKHHHHRRHHNKIHHQKRVHQRRR